MKHDTSSPPLAGRHRTRYGFTLVEMLVVIAIIGILVSLVGAGVGNSLERAQSRACMSNLRQWGTAYLTYCIENNGKSFVYVSKYTYLDPLKDRIDGIETVAICPAVDTTYFKNDSAQVGTAHRAWQYQGDIGSYAMNGFWYGGNGGSNYAYPVPGIRPFPEAWYGIAVGADRPAQAPLFADSVWMDGWPTHNAKVPGDMIEPDGAKPDGGNGPNGRKPEWSMSRFFINRHNGGINMVFADGSSRHVPLTELWNLRWSKSFEPQGPISL